MNNHLKKRLPRAASLKSAVAVQLMLCACYGWADQTDILNSPPFIAGAVKPNILFLMDDSGSMKRTYLPDHSIFWEPRDRPVTTPGSVGVPTHKAFWPATSASNPYVMYGHYSLQCNYLAYNPAVVYTPPLNVDGSKGDAASIADFKNPDYKPFYYVYGAPGTNPPMSFVYNADDSVNTVGSETAFYSECLSRLGSLPGSRVFTRVNVTDSDSLEVKQNFQNWLVYYSNRREMMKTGVKQAFARLNSTYRVGFSVTSYEEATDRTRDPWWKTWKFLNVNDFDADQKRLFFTAVNSSDGEYETPLRGSLSKAGQYFANKAVGQSQDPMQQSCQRNFAILATDGGWTKPGESSGFGPYGVASGRGAGPLLTQQDSGSGVDRPFRDSGTDQVVSLADVTHYYYNTDLRRSDLGNCTGAKDSDGKFPDICKNNVRGVSGTAHESFGDAATHQHMTTYTIGLGLNGRIPFNKDYRSGSSAEFNAIVAGSGQWTRLQDPGSQSNIMPRSHTDDLWHAAVNGHGQHFSATDPVSFVEGLSTALSMIKATTGAAGAAATTSNQPVAGDNDAYVSSFVSQKWIGDVLAYSIDVETGAVDESKDPKWSAKKELDKLSDVSKRKIFFGKAGLDFTAGNLAKEGFARHFEDFCKKKGAGGDMAPAQCMGLTPEQLAKANSAEQLVNYLRGEQGQSYYRKRESRLGDIVNSGLLFVSEKPNFPYSDTSYINYKKKARSPVVLAGANDGMLHAFDKDSGAEKWAYVPKFVMKNMYKLADTNYPDNHVYSVDGTPQIGDVQDPTTKEWHTIVVGGLNAGGKGYYALDITDTAKPKVLWEFEHQHLGLSFGNPIITKRASGQWVVVFASGYNNGTSADPDEPKGDGNGRLFVLDALSGVPSVADPIPTLAGGSPVGRSDTPSGLAKINVWVDKDRDNTMQRVYGGDLLGNVWRFDIDGKHEPHGQALRLAQLRDKDGRAQPVTTKPVLAELRANGTAHAMVYVGTGRYLGMSDLLEKFQVQSLYAFKDPLTNSGHSDLRGAGMVEHQVTGGVDSRTVTLGRAVDLSSDIGWRLDFPVAGERVDINPSIALDTLYVAGNIPAPFTCQAGGSSFVYRFDLKSGKASTRYQGEVLVQGLSLVQITSGARKGAITTIARRTDATTDTFDEDPPPSSRRLKRAAWRALGH
ncbi:PilC/PilY family type IV pilus protein [Acidovorax sp. sic0104]|uniref:pilus assembly protein n=1 Tax=Acidovorax sp. sic0104 TaxID=2854784 RepID=UPI001C446971|nr:hypothetical protein [Acidovorax sp. sic0104]